MSNISTTTMSAPAVPAPTHGDDFNYVEDGGNSIIKGLGKLAFGNDAKWQLREEVIAPATPMREFIVLEHKRFVQEWGVDPGPPLSTRELQPDEYFPDVERSNEETPKERWRMSFGQLKGPFENVHALYLLEQANMNAFTYVASTVGGFKAVRELTEAIRRARLLGNRHLFPVVTLGDTFMPTNFGGRQRPQFNVVRWLEIGKPADEMPALAEPKNADMQGDAIPF